MVALEKRRRGIEDQYLENFRKFRRFVVLTFVLFGIGWLVLKPVRQHEFDYSIFYNVNRDPVGDPIGQPTLDPSNEHLRIGSKAMVSSDVRFARPWEKKYYRGEAMQPMLESQ